MLAFVTGKFSLSFSLLSCFGQTNRQNWRLSQWSEDDSVSRRHEVVSNSGELLTFRGAGSHHMRVGTLIVATIYLQMIQNRYMFRSFTVLQCSHQHCVQPVASDVEVVGYL